MNSTMIIIAIICIMGALGAFFGFITNVPKSFKNTPASHLDAANVKSQAQERIESTENERQKMMDDMKQKISDGQRRY